jgi:hypothetical protein
MAMSRSAFLQGYLSKEAADPLKADLVGRSTLKHAIDYGKRGAEDYGLKGLGIGAGAGALAGGLKELLTTDEGDNAEERKKGILDYLKAMGKGALVGGALGGAGGAVYGGAEQGLRGAMIGSMKPVVEYNTQQTL